MDPGQQQPQQQANGFMGDGVLAMPRTRPQVDQRGPPLDFHPNGQRFWQQEYNGQYDIYRNGMPSQPIQQPINMFVQGNGLPARAPVRHYAPASRPPPLGQRFDEQQFQGISEDFELLAHTQQPSVGTPMPQAPPQGQHPLPAHMPPQPVMVKPLPHISPAPQRRKVEQSADSRKQQRLSLAHDSPHGGAGSGELDDSESDLKRIAMDSLRFPIERAVAHVREDDNSPLAEKSRQVFGMSWLLRSCETKADANVPRNRIYAHYVAACDEFKLKPLNHATFGKLVRMVFPNIKTRRLGVRGHSKYHYCGVALLNSIASLTRTPSPSMTPQPNSLIDSFSPASIQTESPPVNTSVTSITQTPITTPLKSTLSDTSRSPIIATKPFAEELWAVLRGEESHFSVPPLNDYLTSEADPDVVATLYGLYKSQCRALLPTLKNLQFDAFLNQFASFLSSLTVPVQRLLQRHDTLSWVLECDKRLFDEIIYALAPLSLKPLTPEVEHSLQVLVLSIGGCVEQHRKTMPENYVAVKKRLADELVKVINYLLSANESRANLSKIYLNPQDLQAMKTDWMRSVTPQAAADAPCNSSLAGLILTQEVPRLVEPDNSQDPLWYSMQLLSHLWDRFPSASPQIFLLGVSAIATNALKEINRAGGTSFGCWWMYRTWADDWLNWTVNLIQFLRSRPTEFGDLKLLKQEQ